MLCLYEVIELDENKIKYFNHMGLNIENFQNIQAVLEERGIEIEYGGVIDYPDSNSIYIKDPSGYEIELSEHFGGAL